MRGFGLFLQSHGCSREWGLAFFALAMLGTLSHLWAVGATVTADMQQSDGAHLGLSLTVVATSALAAWLLAPAIPWREHTACRPLGAQRLGLTVVTLVLLCWPALPQSGQSLQHIALGCGLFGLSMMVAAVNVRWAAVPQLVALLASLVPTLVPVGWNPLTPTQRDSAFVVVGIGLVLVGVPVWVLSQQVRRDLR